MQIFNARTQQDEDVVFSLSPAGDIIATFADNGFLKFPAGTDEGELQRLTTVHREANQGQEVITEEMAMQQVVQASVAQDMVDRLNGGTPEEDKTDVPTEQPATL